ncbi:hypothetical protein H5410_003267 [Solanum commersonii]|uniref:Secreted protein n=1 Tax=Solanum commersonii TaxID=4109 RepID=A0A9J6B473_SOLCO|nr:hypothetical protein H5410_003267 [Solanum commersonii]
MIFHILYLLPFVLAAASEVNVLHLEYFQFSGRMIVLALAYDVYYWNALGTQINSCNVAAMRY